MDPVAVLVSRLDTAVADHGVAAGNVEDGVDVVGAAAEVKLAELDDVPRADDPDLAPVARLARRRAVAVRVAADRVVAPGGEDDRDGRGALREEHALHDDARAGTHLDDHAGLDGEGDAGIDREVARHEVDDPRVPRRVLRDVPARHVLLEHGGGRGGVDQAGAEIAVLSGRAEVDGRRLEDRVEPGGQEVRVLLEEERGDAGREWRGVGCAGHVVDVPATGRRGPQAVARRGEVGLDEPRRIRVVEVGGDGLPAHRALATAEGVGGRIPDRVTLRDGADRDDAAFVAGGGGGGDVAWRRDVRRYGSREVAPSVAGLGDDRGAEKRGGATGLAPAAAVRRRDAEAHVDDIGAVLDGVLDRLEAVHVVDRGEILEGLADHDPAARGGAGRRAGRAVAGDAAGHTCAMAVEVGDLFRAACEVVAVDVVDVPVAVIVEAVPRDLAGVGPETPGEVGMRLVDARVEDGDDDPLAGQPGRPEPRHAESPEGPGGVVGHGGVQTAPAVPGRGAGRRVRGGPIGGDDAIDARQQGDPADRLRPHVGDDGAGDPERAHVPDGTRLDEGTQLAHERIECGEDRFAIARNAESPAGSPGDGGDLALDGADAGTVCMDHDARVPVVCRLAGRARARGDEREDSEKQGETHDSPARGVDAGHGIPSVRSVHRVP